MSKTPTISAKSIVLEDDRTADGKTVTTAVVELMDGTKLRARTPEHVLYIGDLPVDREVTLLAHPGSGVERIENPAPRIERSRTELTQWSTDVHGSIEELSVDSLPKGDSKFHVLDVGVGSMYIPSGVSERIVDSGLPLQIGEGLYVPTSWLELWDVYP
jgi:hypothetical protein